MSHLVKTDPLMCCDTALVIHVNFLQIHISGPIYTLQYICCSVYFISEMGQTASFLHNSVVGLFFTSRAILTGKTGDVQDVGVYDMSSQRSLAHQQHNLSLCKKS